MEKQRNQKEPIPKHEPYRQELMDIDLRKNPQHRIHSQAEFHEIIRYESSRVNRIGSSFAVIVYTLDKRRMNKEALEQFAGEIFENLRAVDRMGWYDSQNLGILLINVNKAGVLKFLENIKKRVTFPPGLGFKTIYYYPTQWDGTHKDQKGSKDYRSFNKDINEIMARYFK